MNRIEQCFESLRAEGRKALIPYITAGDPHPDTTVQLMHGMVAAGANILELGVPFSDPMADGPVIQRAEERALLHRVNLPRVFDMVCAFRDQDKHTPIVLMGYLNPVEAMGYEHFVVQAAQAGVDGVLTVDLPPEEAKDLIALMTAHKIAPIFLIAPTTLPDRIARICDGTRGFIYYVSLKGTTGASHLDIASVTSRLKVIRSVTNLPIGVGFGISDAKMAAEVAQISDAVVVGSAIVKQIEEHGRQGALDAVQSLLKEMRTMMDQSIS